MQRIRTAAAGLVRASFAVLVAAACGRQTSGGKVVEDGRVWSVRLGASGGFTGGGSGHVIFADGTVRAWSQVVPSDSIATQDFGKAMPEAVAALRRALEDPAMRQLRYTATGNMTGSLDWFDGTTMHHWSWAEKVGRTDLPAPLARARNAAMTAVRTARP